MDVRVTRLEAYMTGPTHELQTGKTLIVEPGLWRVSRSPSQSRRGEEQLLEFLVMRRKYTVQKLLPDAVLDNKKRKGPQAGELEGTSRQAHRSNRSRRYHEYYL